MIRSSRKYRCGYILFEAVVSMAILSLSVVGIHRVMREAIITRGQSHDYTMAKFFAEEVMSTLELQPRVVEGSGGGTCDDSRFRYEWKISKVQVPEPPMPPNLPPDQIEQYQLAAKYLAKVQATIIWERNGVEFREKLQTLWPPEKIFVPKEEEAPFP